MVNTKEDQTKFKDYEVYKLGDRLISGRQLKIGHRIFVENADLSTLLAEEVMELSIKQPDGVKFCDADTILADLVKKCDFQISGISGDLLKLYLEAENKEDFKSLFYMMTDTKFENYLLKSKEVMEKNIAESKSQKYRLTEGGEKTVLDFMKQSYKTQNILHASGTDTIMDAYADH